MTDGTKAEYGLDGSVDVHATFAMDQFIGNPACWNRGLGTRAISLVLGFLFEEQAAETVLVDPHAGNARAIRCYEKCGFRKVRPLPRNEWHEGAYRDCWLMAARRPA